MYLINLSRQELFLASDDGFFVHDRQSDITSKDLIFLGNLNSVVLKHLHPVAMYSKKIQTREVVLLAIYS
jgi:hypothetical protein